MLAEGVVHTTTLLAIFTGGTLRDVDVCDCVWGHVRGRRERRVLVQVEGDAGHVDAFASKKADTLECEDGV